MPRISARWILSVVTGTVFIAWIIRQALRGDAWAVAMLFPLAAAATYFILSFGLFLVAWIPAMVIAQKNPDRREGNPFAADQLPPQILPPKGS